jgi:hypothetical protein
MPTGYAIQVFSSKVQLMAKNPEKKYSLQGIGEITLVGRIHVPFESPRFKLNSPFSLFRPNPILVAVAFHALGTRIEL